jgi:uncharacterized SAM-binding protein YcdF (DUF218 family)
MTPVAGWRASVRRTVRWTLVTAVLVLLLFLPFAGRFLVADDPLEKADLILVFAGARVERWLEAAELYKEGWAPRIVLSPGPVEPIEQQLAARGVVYPREGDLARQALIDYGIPADAVTVLPGGVDNTAHEAAVVARTLSGTGRARLIIVTSPYHTRRAGVAFRRALAGAHVAVIVRATRFSKSDPSRWWRRREDVRYVLNELPKLLAYALGVGE